MRKNHIYFNTSTTAEEFYQKLVDAGFVISLGGAVNGIEICLEHLNYSATITRTKDALCSTVYKYKNNEYVPTLKSTYMIPDQNQNDGKGNGGNGNGGNGNDGKGNDGKGNDGKGNGGNGNGGKGGNGNDGKGNGGNGGNGNDGKGNGGNGNGGNGGNGNDGKGNGGNGGNGNDGKGNDGNGGNGNGGNGGNGNQNGQTTNEEVILNLDLTSIEDMKTAINYCEVDPDVVLALIYVNLIKDDENLTDINNLDVIKSRLDLIKYTYLYANKVRNLISKEEMEPLNVAGHLVFGIKMLLPALTRNRDKINNCSALYDALNEMIDSITV